MFTRNVENRLALVGAVLILVAVAAAATTAFNSKNELTLEFAQMGPSSTLVAGSR